MIYRVFIKVKFDSQEFDFRDIDAVGDFLKVLAASAVEPVEIKIVSEVVE